MRYNIVFLGLAQLALAHVLPQNADAPVARHQYRVQGMAVMQKNVKTHAGTLGPLHVQGDAGAAVFWRDSQPHHIRPRAVAYGDGGGYSEEKDKESPSNGHEQSTEVAINKEDFWWAKTTPEATPTSTESSSSTGTCTEGGPDSQETSYGGQQQSPLGGEQGDKESSTHEHKTHSASEHSKGGHNHQGHGSEQSGSHGAGSSQETSHGSGHGGETSSDKTYQADSGSAGGHSKEHGKGDSSSGGYGSESGDKKEGCDEEAEEKPHGKEQHEHAGHPKHGHGGHEQGHSKEHGKSEPAGIFSDWTTTNSTGQHQKGPQERPEPSQSTSTTVGVPTASSSGSSSRPSDDKGDDQHGGEREGDGGRPTYVQVAGAPAMYRAGSVVALMSAAAAAAAMFALS